MKLPDFKFEEPLWKDGFTVIGIDEVGRGAFAGPVAVGGVVFDPSLNSAKKEYLLSLGIADSKKLTPKKRESLSEIIKKECSEFSVCFIDVPIINEVGIGKATFMAMENVARELFGKTQNPFLLIDAFEIPNISKNKQKGIIYGDNLSISIAAASIIAKVTRDKLMEDLSLKFPQYGFDKHKGYGTAFHRNAIREYGVSKNHRLEFCKKTLS